VKKPYFSFTKIQNIWIHSSTHFLNYCKLLQKNSQDMGLNYYLTSVRNLCLKLLKNAHKKPPLILHVQYKHGKCPVKTEPGWKQRKNCRNSYPKVGTAIKRYPQLPSQCLQIVVFSNKGNFFAVAHSYISLGHNYIQDKERKHR